MRRGRRIKGEGYWTQLSRKFCLGLLGLLLALKSVAVAVTLPETPNPQQFVRKVWQSPADCQAVWQAGQHWPKAPQTLRLATWNLHWFPDGRPDELAPSSSTKGTDPLWLACTLAFMQADIVALQEIKFTAAGLATLDSLIRYLEQFTQERWQIVKDVCLRPDRQHLAFLYKESAVAISYVATHDVIDPTSLAKVVHHKLRPKHKAKKYRFKKTKKVRPPSLVKQILAKDLICLGKLRPALGMYVEGRGVLAPLHFHLVTTHLDAGRQERDFRNRLAALALLDKVYQERLKLKKGQSLVVAADFNPMGCPAAGVTTNEAEWQLFKQTLLKLAYPLTLPAFAPGVGDCTLYYKGQPYKLDAIVYGRELQRFAASSLQVLGLCAGGLASLASEDGQGETAGMIAPCTPLQRGEAGPGPSKLLALRHLSDHCPVLLDLHIPLGK